MTNLKTDLELGLTNLTPEEADRNDAIRLEMFKNLAKTDSSWTADDELNARICEATDGMCSLSHTGY